MSRPATTAIVIATALLCASGCTCGASHTVDAGGALDAGDVTDAGPPDAGSRDAGLPRLPPEACEAVFSGGAGAACAPETTSYCGVERCCLLWATCIDGTLDPTEVRCTDEPVEPTCALTAANADVSVTVDGVMFSLRYAYADHGVGFATYVDLTFTPDGEANVCAAQRLSISALGPIGDLSSGEPAYDGTHDVTFQWTDETATPRFRFFLGRVTITSSLPFRSAGPVTGSLSADDGLFQVRGTFDAPECEPWQTSGS